MRRLFSVVLLAAFLSFVGGGVPVHAAVTPTSDCTAGGDTAVALNDSGLTKFRAALTTTATAPLDVMFVGDSLTEGWGVTTDAVRFQDLLIRSLRRSQGIADSTGGEGFVPFWHPAPGFGVRWTTGTTTPGGPKPAFAANGFGLGSRAGVLAVGQWATVSTAGDQVWVAYTQGPGVGNLGITVDGGPETIVNTYASTTKSGRLWKSGALSRGSHVVHMRPVASASVVVDGVVAIDGDATSGVRGWDGGLSGASAQSFARTTQNYFDTVNDVVDPDLIIVGIGTNDMYARQTPAQYAANLRTIVNRYRTGTATTPPAPNASILLWIEPNRADMPSATWQQFVNVAYDVARTEHTGLADMYSRMGTANVSDFFSDVIHPSAGGNRMIGDGLAQSLGRLTCAPIGGRVLASGGESTAGTCSEAFDASTGTAVSLGRAASDGAYTLWTPPGSYKVRFTDCANLGLQSTWIGGVDFLSASTMAGGIDGLTNTLASPPALRGRLTDINGVSVVGICVFARNSVTGLVLPMTVSASDGAYAFVNPAPGMYKLGFWDCTYRGYATTWHLNVANEADAVPVAAGTPGIIDVMLNRAITGRLVDAAGAPLAGICVAAVDSATNVSLTMTRSAADGTYSFANPAGTAYLLGFWDCAAGRYRATWHLNTPDKANAMAVMPGAPSLTDVMPII